jgi:hypothetical protein
MIWRETFAVFMLIMKIHAGENGRTNGVPGFDRGLYP